MTSCSTPARGRFRNLKGVSAAAQFWTHRSHLFTNISHVFGSIILLKSRCFCRSQSPSPSLIERRGHRVRGRGAGLDCPRGGRLRHGPRARRRRLGPRRADADGECAEAAVLPARGCFRITQALLWRLQFGTLESSALTRFDTALKFSPNLQGKRVFLSLTIALPIFHRAQAAVPPHHLHHQGAEAQQGNGLRALRPLRLPGVPVPAAHGPLLRVQREPRLRQPPPLALDHPRRRAARLHRLVRQ